MNIEIIDDIINTDLEIKIYEAMTSIHFPWFYQKKGTVNNIERDIKGVYDAPQFCHVFYKRENGITEKNSENCHIADLLLTAYMDYKQTNISLLRSKANFQCQSPINGNEKRKFNPPHVDLIDAGDYITAIYYVNNSDGDTYFFDDDYNVIKKVSPKMGRLVVFDGNIFHAGNHPIKSQERIVINYGFKIV